MALWTAFVLGIVGSLHCAAMCGPITLALRAPGKTRTGRVTGQVIYNFGRVSTYCILGALAGAVGQGFAVAGLQRWLSLVAGAVILAGLITSSGRGAGSLFGKIPLWVKPRLGALLARRALGSQFLFGAVNALLPCGLVYIAVAAAAATGGFLSGIESMFAFGMGTFPMMLAVGLGGSGLARLLRFRFPSLVPISIGAVGALLILRGMSLGIPFLSPSITSEQVTCPTCL